MAQWSAGAGSRATLVHDVSVIGSNTAGNYSTIRVQTWAAISGGSGITNNVGDANWHVTSGGNNVSSAFTYSGWSGQWYGLNSYDMNVGHDVNGNCTIGVYAYVNGANGPYFTAASINTSMGLARLPLAPAIAARTADQIKPTSVRLGTEISSNGHGTSSACRFYYRLQGSGTWLQTGDQSDTAGYNYFNVTGLKPGKTYEYFARWWNNNGDTADSSQGTFKTKSISGMVTVLTGLL